MATPLYTFDFVTNENHRKMFETALTAITHLELWEFMRNFPENDSFMFSSSQEVDQIYRKIEELGYTGHSGASFGCTMRAMELIGKKGIDKFRIEYVSSTNQS